MWSIIYIFVVNVMIKLINNKLYGYVIKRILFYKYFFYKKIKIVFTVSIW